MTLESGVLIGEASSLPTVTSSSQFSYYGLTRNYSRERSSQESSPTVINYAQEWRANDQAHSPAPSVTPLFLISPVFLFYLLLRTL